MVSLEGLLELPVQFLAVGNGEEACMGEVLARLLSLPAKPHPKPLTSYKK